MPTTCLLRRCPAENLRHAMLADERPSKRARSVASLLVTQRAILVETTETRVALAAIAKERVVTIDVGDAVRNMRAGPRLLRTPSETIG